MGKIMDWLTGKKEILVATLTGLALIAASAGLAPEHVAALRTIAAEVAAGNWLAALSALASGALLLMRAAWRAKINRDDAPYDRDHDQP